MACTQTTWLSNEEYLKQFNNKVVKQRIPLSGSLDLTHRCNLRCVHCYLGDKRSLRKKQRAELNTIQWLSVLDQITEAGCLYLVMTGGEPLLRKDFGEIYSHAKRNGLLVTVFTNGTLVTNPIIGLFEDLPPYAVEISLYGASAATYERITGVPGSFERCLKGTESLLERGVNVKLKTILMTYNRHEFPDMKRLADAYGVKFRFDAAIFPCFNGDKTPIELRVSPEEAIEREFSEEGVLQEWWDLLERFKDIPVSDDLYQCGAGLAMFHVDAHGGLSPCVMVNGMKYDLSSGCFFSGWYDLLPRIREKKAGPGTVCSQCDKKILCGYCPPFFELENGSEDACSEYLCAMGKHRFEAIERANL